jgi:uracil-DNA glycosylase family protein
MKRTSLNPWHRLREQAQHCRACPLYKNATQTVLGEGLVHAEIVLLGEQPGDQEDRAGQPFVGPAGRLLDRALADAGIDRTKCYVTNAVKHFKWVPRGKLRLHRSPNAHEIAACRPWWEKEVQLVRPRALVCLGATAARAVFGRVVKVMTERGLIAPSAWVAQTLITVHPSSLLRAPDSAQRAQAYARFVADLQLLRSAIS